MRILLVSLLGFVVPAAALAQPVAPLATVKYLAAERCRECPEMVMVPAGSFVMGSNRGEASEQPAHRVAVASFWMGRTEVTQEQWIAVMGRNPSKFIDCDDCPVENVSWDDAQAYLKALNDRTGMQYRLPTEAEWEFACRGAGNAQFCGGDDVDRVAWTDSDRGATEPRTVAQKDGNHFGLHDMSGNVWEWVQDCWNPSYAGAPEDGREWATGECGRRVLRGGSWGFEPNDARATSRFRNKANTGNFYLGFRVAHSLMAPPAK